MAADEVLPCASLGELVRLSNEKAFGKKLENWPYVGLEHLDSGSPTLARTSPSSASTSTNGVFLRDDVLFGKLRPYLRKSVAAPFDGYCSTDLLVLRPSENVDPRFAAKVLQSEPVFAEAVATSMGTKMPRTSWAKLRGMQVFSPPLPEQRRIAEILDTLDDGIRKTEQVIAKLQQMKQGLLHDLLTRGIDEHGELRDPERYPEQFKDSPLGRIPRSWEVCPLRQCLQRAPQNGLYKPAGAIGRGALMVGQTAFTAARSIDYTLARRAAATRSEMRTWGLKGGDLLVSRVFATADGVGQPVLVPEPPEPAVYESNMMRLKVDQSLITPTLIFHWLRHPIVRQHLLASVNSSNQSSINQNGLGLVPVGVPTPAEQTALGEAAEAWDRRLEDEKLGLDKLRTLKHGLMHDLLTGRVRVPATEEPTP